MLVSAQNFEHTKKFFRDKENNQPVGIHFHKFIVSNFFSNSRSIGISVFDSFNSS